MIREITESEFRKKLCNKDGDFSGYIFDFSFSLTDYIKQGSDIDFKINFSRSIFKKEISFAKIAFYDSFNFSDCQVEEFVDFFNTRFSKDFEAKRSEFLKKADFNNARFHADADFSYAIFRSSAHFKKTRFHKNLFMGRSLFYAKIDFSYAHFSNDHYTNFSSENSNSGEMNKKKEAPYFIFRNIFFTKKTIFNSINLSKTVFQDSIIDSAVFKKCIFPKEKGRNIFYAEVAHREKIVISEGLKNLVEKKLNTIILPNNNFLQKVNIGDILEITSRNSGKKEVFFVVTRFDIKENENLRSYLQKVNLKNIYSGFDKIICQDCRENNTEENGLVGFRLKKFDKEKHWEVLEDNYRQMKKSLEESRDWQGAGNFYRGEMNAKINLLESRGEQFWYRNILKLYKQISSFGESAKRISLTMLGTFVLASINLYFFKPELSIFEIIEKNIGFFLPIFGNNATIISSLKIQAWQGIIVQFEIIWFYMLWLAMAMTVQRRFRR